MAALPPIAMRYNVWLSVLLVFMHPGANNERTRVHGALVVYRCDSSRHNGVLLKDGSRYACDAKPFGGQDMRVAWTLLRNVPIVHGGTNYSNVDTHSPITSVLSPHGLTLAHNWAACDNHTNMNADRESHILGEANATSELARNASGHLKVEGLAMLAIAVQAPVTRGWAAISFPATPGSMVPAAAVITSG